MGVRVRAEDDAAGPHGRAGRAHLRARARDGRRPGVDRHAEPLRRLGEPADEPDRVDLPILVVDGLALGRLEPDADPLARELARALRDLKPLGVIAGALVRAVPGGIALDRVRPDGGAEEDPVREREAEHARRALGPVRAAGGGRVRDDVTEPAPKPPGGR